MRTPIRHHIVPPVSLAFAASLILAGCGGDDAQPDVDPSVAPTMSTAPEPSGTGCPPEGFAIPEVAVGETIDLGGAGLSWELTCFVVDAPTRITVGAYPLNDSQDQLLIVDRLDPSGTRTVGDDVADPYRTNGWTGAINFEGVTSSDDAVGLLPRATITLERGTYLVYVRPAVGDGETPLSPTRVFVRDDGGNGIADFSVSGNTWVEEQAAYGVAACSPAGYDVPEFHVTKPGQLLTVGGVGDEWALVCLARAAPTTIATGAFPVSGEQDLRMEIMRLNPTGEYSVGAALDAYRASPDAADVRYDSVLTADDELGFLPWGQTELDAGTYLIAVTRYETTPLEAATLFLYTDGADHLAAFGDSTNPWVVAQYDAYMSANSGD